MLDLEKKEDAAANMAASEAEGDENRW